MLGVDRLDMIKGIPQKLLAFEKFLEEHPEWRDKVLLVQIAVPSRTDVPEYQARVLYIYPCCGPASSGHARCCWKPAPSLPNLCSCREAALQRLCRPTSCACCVDYQHLHDLLVSSAFLVGASVGDRRVWLACLVQQEVTFRCNQGPRKHSSTEVNH